MIRSLTIVVLLCSVAQAQRGEQPTTGVYNPTIGLAGDTDASAIDKNPATLGWLKSWNGVFLYSNPNLDGARRIPGQGGGLFVATPLPYLSSISVGAAIQLLQAGAGFPFGDSQKFTLALGWKLSPSFGIGLNYSHLWSQYPPVSVGIDTMDLAVAFRIVRWVAGALVVRDVTAPVVDGLPLQRIWDAELAFRPLGTDRVELALGARFGERRQDVDPRVRLWVTAAPGVTFKTELEVRRDVDLDGVFENDVRVAMGLQLDLERIGVGAYGLFGSDSGVTRGHGFTVAARVSGERYPAIWRGPRYLEKIDIGPNVTGRKLAALIWKLRRLERDRTVSGVMLVIGAVGGGWATAEELRGALGRLREKGKSVYAYITDTSSRGYYIASAAERIFQDPAGGIQLLGLSSTQLYFKGFGDLVGIKADFVKIAEYKAAPEMYTRTGPSEPAREQKNQYLDDVYRHLVGGIAQGRKLSQDKVRAIIDSGPLTARDALASGLVDELRAGDEVEGALSEKAGRRVHIRETSKAPERDRSWMRPQISVIVVDGDITSGKSYDIPLLDMRFIGMQTLLPAIARARDDQRVRAIVLRINSPGGSALASDLIAREIERTRQVKPVICSLGDVAASGGYFIAAPCDKIFASPSTLTGSIGIFTGKFDLSGLAQKLGVTFERFERGQHASMESLYRPYTDEERAHILTKLRYYYDRFVDQVARGRNLKPAAVDAIARGHIWSGSAAKERGLIDASGTFADAVAEALHRSNLSEDALVEIVAAPEEWSISKWLLGLIGLNLQAAAAPVLAIAPGLIDLLHAMPGSLLSEPSTPQARLDGELVVR